MRIDEAKLLIQSQLTNKRFEHSLRVAETAKNLAAMYGVGEHEAELAGVLHDYAKDFPADRLKEILIKNNLSEDLLRYNEELWHAPVGAFIMETAYGIEDSDILNAIKFHTTGRAQMSKLELVIFVADYIEPGRSFPGVDEVREMAQKDLMQAAWMVSRNTIQFLLQKNVLVYPDTIHVYNDLTRRLF